ncbi:MAG TPA: type VI secretion system tip protein TssI/VgrG, partial [Polyangiaceae bacterium]|nr:type VI secretion system tip protein TssI/VgrG [Polyangiaceae bacterium]
MKTPLFLELESGIASLEVRRVSAHERMSQLFVVDVLARSDDPQIDLNAVVAKGAGVAGETPSGLLAWTGVCSYMEQVKPAQDLAGHSTYFLRIVPALWLLTQRRNHRIFQHETTPDIVKKILGEYRIEPTLELTGEYARHEYCVQYGESDFAFVSRLLEQAGISYFFRRQKQGDKAVSVLVLSDAPQRGESIGGIYYYDMPNEGDLEEPFITDVQLAHGVRAGKVTVRDFDFRKPRLSILDSSSFPLADGEKPEDNYEQYHYLPGVSLFEVDSAEDKLEMADDKSIARHLPKHNKVWAEREAEAARHQKRRVGFRSNHASLAPSKIFSIDHHPRHLDDESLMVVELDTFVSELEWAVVGTAVFAKTPYRPEVRTPKPRVAGIQTAMVVGPPGREIHTDEFGRVRVRFHWDREGQFDDESTCWLRVSHAWAGTSFGTMHVPRIGQEVIVDYLDGDPDQPFIVGRVFNSTTRVPRRLPLHKTQSIWRSATSPQTDGKFNEIMFEDAAGQELYFMQAERDLLRLTKRNDTERTGEDRTIVVGEGRVSAVAASDSLQVGKQHLVKMVKTNDLHIPDMGEPDVQPLDTFVEMVDRKITLTTGNATIQLDGPNITIDAKGGLRFTTDGRLIMKGSKVYLNVMPGQVQPRASTKVTDVVAKPDRMIGSV